LVFPWKGCKGFLPGRSAGHLRFVLEGFVGVGRVVRHRSRIILDLLLEQIDGCLKLRVRPTKGCVRKVIDYDVGIDAVSFDDPFSRRVVDACFTRARQAPVGLSVAAGEPDFAAPGARAEHLAQLEALEAFRERLAV